MVEVLSKQQINEIVIRKDGPPEPSYLSLWQPFDSPPNDSWGQAYEDITSLIDSHEELRTRLTEAERMLGLPPSADSSLP